MIFSNLYDRYVMKSLGLATLFTAATLAMIILLTQSLRFLELIINSGASSVVFWALAFLALPRFLEVILPVSVMISIIFIYNRMQGDSEIVVMRAAGTSPMELARPALFIAGIVTICLIFITTWLAPASLKSMNLMRQTIKAQYSALLFKEGIFNTVNKDLMVYIDNRTDEGELEGLLIHDSRESLEQPVTILARRGVIVMTNEGQQVVVYDGSRQDLNPKTGALNRLDFDRYTIDLPEAGAVRMRWQEPSERTFFELFNPDKNSVRDMEYKDKFIAEAQRRIIGPFLALGYAAIVLCCLLLGPVSRRGQTKRILIAVISVIILQSLYLSVYNLAAENALGMIGMYGLVFLPIIFCLLLLGSQGEILRHKILYRKRRAVA